MLAVAPLVDEPTPVGAPFDEVADPATADAAAMRDAIAEQGLELARSAEIPESVELLVDDLADAISGLPANTAFRIDPYLLLAAQQALIGCLRAFDLDDRAQARRQLRVRLEQIRQVYRDLAEAGPLYADRPAKEVARWLESVVDVPQARLAAVLGVSARTFQRWVSETHPTAPEGDDARRLRVLAAVANHLRHALTGPGAIAWFERPHPRLDGRPPRDLLDEPAAAGRLTALAASTRSHSAA
ncbi:MAG: hypothetical protein WD993_08535 [Thermoleophilaceae bacterium]